MLVFRHRRVSMLDLHISLSAILWGAVVLLPPNNLFHTYLTLRVLGSYGLSEIWTGTFSIFGGLLFLWSILYGTSTTRRVLMVVGAGWWSLVSIAAVQTPLSIPPAAAMYALTAVMCGVQAIRACHHDKLLDFIDSVVKSGTYEP